MWAEPEVLKAFTSDMFSFEVGQGVCGGDKGADPSHSQPEDFGI